MKQLISFVCLRSLLNSLLLFKLKFLKLPLGITRVWLDRTESNVLLYILAHRDLQTYFSQVIHSSPAKDTSEVNNVKTEHSQKNSCVCY